MDLTLRITTTVVILSVSLLAQDRSPSGNLSQDIIPVHSAPPDPQGGEYGIWAAGPTWKASFHDGFCFYPFLGSEAPRHLPLHWRTEAVTVGAEALALTAPKTRTDTWRVEIDRGEVIEAYDVRRQGVEQTFVIRERPRSRGNLVVIGHVTTPLHAASTEPAHQSLSFGQDGREVVRYGEARAVDAAGAETPVATEFDGERIRLTVAGEFLARAVYPIVLDPLVQAGNLTPGATDLIVDAASASRTTVANARVLTVYVRQFNSGDTDLFAVTSNLDQTGISAVFSDVHTWGTPTGSACYVGGPDEFVIALERDFSASDKQLRLRTVPGGATSTSGGTLLAVAQSPAGTVHVLPRIGGSMLTSRAFVVFERRNTSSGVPSVFGARIDFGPTTVQAPVSLIPTGIPVFERYSQPDIVPQTFSNSPWIVTFRSETTSSPSVQRVRVGWIRYDGTNAGMQVLRTLPATSSVDLPKVAGMSGRYLVTYGEVAPAGVSRIHAIRFDWTSSGTAPSIVAQRIVAQEVEPFFGSLVRNEGLAFDSGTTSHWVGTFSIGPGLMRHWVARLGYTGGTTEQHEIPLSLLNSAYSRTAVSFARPNTVGVFQLAQVLRVVGRTGTTEFLVRGMQLAYPSDAISSIYGSSCATGVTSATNRSYAGHEFFRSSLQGLLSRSLAIYVFGLAPANIDLTPNGMPGCFLNVAPPAMLGTFIALADGTGTATVSYSLPDSPLFVGDVFSQWFYHDPSATPQPFRAYFGVKHQVR